MPRQEYGQNCRSFITRSSSSWAPEKTNLLRWMYFYNSQINLPLCMAYRLAAVDSITCFESKMFQGLLLGQLD